MRLRGTNFCISLARFALSFVRQPNGPKCIQIVQCTPKHEFRVQWAGSGAVIMKNSDATSWHELLHQFGPFCTEFCNTSERSQMYQNSMKRYETWVLGPMGWIGCLTRLHGTNFCTTSARFAPSFVRQPNGTKCIQIVWTHQNISLGPNGANQVWLLRKMKTRLRCTNFCTRSARFALSFVRQPNGLKCIQIVRNTPKYEFRVQWGGSGAFVVKDSDATSWHEFLQKFGPFWTECCNATNCPKCTQIVRNTPIHEARVQWGGSGAFVAKNSDTTSWHEILYHFGPFCTEFCNATKWYLLHPNSTKHTKTLV